MEGQNKSVSNGFNHETGNNNNNNIVGNKRAIGSCETLLRLLAAVLTLSAAVILGVDKQTKVVPIKVLDNLPPMNVPVYAKWHYLSAFLYFVVTNAIAAAYGAMSLVLSFAIRCGKKTGLLLIFILDVVMVGLLFSSNGAAVSIGMMGFKGNSHVQWNKVCDVFDKFCHQGMVALVVSLLGSIAFLLLVILASKRLHHHGN